VLLKPRGSAVRRRAHRLWRTTVIEAGVLAAGLEDPAFLASVRLELAISSRHVTVNLQAGGYPRSSRLQIR
jgi:hypothetical protein